jgi:hypothetical protein
MGHLSRAARVNGSGFKSRERKMSRVAYCQGRLFARILII